MTKLRAFTRDVSNVLDYLLKTLWNIFFIITVYLRKCLAHENLVEPIFKIKLQYNFWLLNTFRRQKYRCKDLVKGSVTLEMKVIAEYLILIKDGFDGSEVEEVWARRSSG